MAKDVSQMIREKVDNNDRDGVKFIFKGAFDADPTFEKYEDGFTYCQEKNFFEPYQPMTEFREDKTQWDKGYWRNLQEDFLQNMSEKRLEHMREVALVIFQDKVEKLRAERSKNTEAASTHVSGRTLSEDRPPISNTMTMGAGFASVCEYNEEKRQNAARANEAAEPYQRQWQIQQGGSNYSGGTPPKKAPWGMGVILLLAIFLAAALGILIMIVVTEG